MGAQYVLGISLLESCVRVSNIVIWHDLQMYSAANMGNFISCLHCEKSVIVFDLGLPSCWWHMRNKSVKLDQVYMCWSSRSYLSGHLRAWASCQIRKMAGCASAGNTGKVFPATAVKRSQHASQQVRDARTVMHAGIANKRFPLMLVAGKTFPAFPAHAQPAI